MTKENISKQKAIDVLLAGYDRTQEYPFEIVNKGGAVGEELY